MTSTTGDPSLGEWVRSGSPVNHATVASPIWTTKGITAPTGIALSIPNAAGSTSRIEIAPSNDDVYMSFLMKITDITACQDGNNRFILLGRDIGGFVGVLMVVKQATTAPGYVAGNFQLLLSQGSGGASPSDSDTFSKIYNANNETELFVVIKRVNDATPTTPARFTSVFINPTLGATEPATPSIEVAVDRSGSMNYFSIFQLANSENTPAFIMDELRIATTWAEAIDYKETTWNGSGTANDWTDVTNWTGGLPNPSTNNIIPSGLASYPTIATPTSVKAITLDNGASLIANAAITGPVTHTRSLVNTAGNTNGWYLVSSPVAGQDYNETYVTANSIAVATSTNRGIATYTETDNTWAYMASGGSGTFNAGQGYSVKVDANDAVSFTGTVNSADVLAPISRAATGATTGFNLIGNPYTSYISSETLLDNNPILSANKTIWTWSNATNSYTPRISTANFMIAPGQGFFVQVNDGATGSVTFAQSNQAHNGATDTFQKGGKTEVSLKIADAETYREAKIYYTANAFKGFESGYEGEVFGGIPNSFQIYTHVLEGNTGRNFQVQTLPDTALETMVVPLGVKAATGKELSFSAEALNLPAGINVFLEDRETNTFTRLDEANAVYAVTATTALNGVGRFYIHTTTQAALSVADLALQGVSIYKTDASTVRIAGLTDGKATVSLFSILGKKVMTSSFNAAEVKDISLPKLATGVYIVQLETVKGKLNKKIILE
ncbi:T9SS type A sorting domain-containing protein [Polaribacter glomeratus]|uniref:Secretion system C-terminal sorting domain-containing protein n=1 Tax=Polaribacter glomeratus TaxID=102 RepID=A0A2S7WUT6_9FLAO|nr:T9SS type A sorting domain-containing protein [Polaribacter glomeratus]PQJ81349.1 hypothetical protein BTO16_01585 [Polaribacter glomeratus]TXD64853.1 T9SS type A sorting domain-containing protein [Polaribacter glomeratus]